MGVGKYSPTVTRSYMLDQKWWYKNGGGHGNGKNPESDLDDDGFDSYGYSGEFGDGPDRAGHTEDEYLTGYEVIDDELDHFVYNRVDSEWRDKVLGKLAESG